MRAPRTWIWFVILCAAAYVLTAPGRITYPDDEIVFQTTQSLYERGTLEIPGIAKRSGERSSRPAGTFGWEHGSDGKRYGFFGHGLSVVALPMYGAAIATAGLVPESWTHAPRRDLFSFHYHSAHADWTRQLVSLTNCLITAFAAWVLARWGIVLGLGRRACIVTALAYAFCTSAWPYTSTFLSEPLSALCLLACALAIARYHRDGLPRQLWVAGALAGASVHVHLLNLLALPCLFGYAIAPAVRGGSLSRTRSAWLGGTAAGLLGVALLGLSHWARFGSPFETGRYDNYGSFIWPWEGLAAQLIAPGRSFFLYSPAVVLALIGWPRLRRMRPDAAWLIVALFVLRWGFISARSDWYGGWGVGPRYLVPMIPFAMLPLAVTVEDRLGGSAGSRRAWIGALVACALLEGWMAAHSVFEHMWDLMMRHGAPDYFAVSHWSLEGSPIVGYWRFDAPALAELFGGSFRAAVGAARLDALAFGAVRLAVFEHYSLLVAMLAVAALGVWAGVRLARALARPDQDPRPADPTPDA